MPHELWHRNGYTDKSFCDWVLLIVIDAAGFLYVLLYFCFANEVRSRIVKMGFIQKKKKKEKELTVYWIYGILNGLSSFSGTKIHSSICNENLQIFHCIVIAR